MARALEPRAARVRRALRRGLLAAVLLFVAVRVEADPVGPLPQGSARDAVAVLDAPTLLALEERGYRFSDVLHARGESGRALARAPLYRALVSTLSADLRELATRDGVGRAGDANARNHPFRASWLTDPRARFELVGLVNRLDRGRLLGSERACGETRLVYRLALAPRGRPTARLPMTVSLAFPQPTEEGCAAVARAWLAIPRSGRARLDALASRLEASGPLAEMETNLQSLHGGPTLPDQDDHSEYLLRGFDVRGDALVPKPLLGTPREDLDANERAQLLAWVRESFDAIDRGSARLPDALSATRALSVTPRGLARPENRVFGRLLGDARARAALAELPYDGAARVRSPAALLRRLDESTCQGCHQTRAVAGFHLLGDAREPDALAALAVGASPHLLAELEWRRSALEAEAESRAAPAPEPFADHPRAGGGRGAPCGLGDAGFAAWTCAAGLRCRDVNGDGEVGACAPDGASGDGDACEDARVVGARGADGDRLSRAATDACVSVTGASASCGTAEYGFAGGLCAAKCSASGERRGDLVCAEVPRAGYEGDCFLSREPIEACLARHTDRAWLARCDASTPCRDDYACVRVRGAAPGSGACAPPYFVFETRVDGPRLDR